MIKRLVSTILITLFSMWGSFETPTLPLIKKNPLSENVINLSNEETNSTSSTSVKSIDTIIEKVNQSREETVNILFFENGIRENGIVKSLDGIHTNNDYQYNSDGYIIIYKDFEMLVDCGLGIYSRTTDETIINKGVDELVDIMKKLVSNDKSWDSFFFTHFHTDHIMGAPNLITRCVTGTSGFSVQKIYDFALPNKTYTEIDSIDTISLKYAGIMTANSGLHVPVSSLFYNSNEELLSNPNPVIKEDKKNDFCVKFFRNDIEFIKEEKGLNNSSIPLMVSFKNQKFLFTGDLEDEGIRSLMNKYDSEIQNVTFYKAGHHGAKNANPRYFINHIKPQYVVVPAVMGSKNNEGQHRENYYPYLDVADYLFKYTDYIYASSVAAYDRSNETTIGYASLYGDMLFQFDGNGASVYTSALSNDNCEPLMQIQSTKWFSKERDPQFSIYTFSDRSKKAKHYNCTLYKFGHYDIVIDCGSDDVSSTDFVDQLKNYVIDGKIEYLVVSQANKTHISQLVGDSGLFNKFVIETISDFNEDTNHTKSESSYPIYTDYKKLLDEEGANYITVDDGKVQPIVVTNVRKYPSSASNIESINEHYETIDLTLKIIDASYGIQENENDYSLCTVIDFFDHRSVFLSDLDDYQVLVGEFREDIANAQFVKASCASSTKANSQDILKVLKSETSVIGAPLNNKETDFGDKNYTTGLITGSYEYNKKSEVIPSSYIDASNSVVYINELIDYTYSPLNGRVASIRGGEQDNCKKLDLNAIKTIYSR